MFVRLCVLAWLLFFVCLFACLFVCLQCHVKVGVRSLDCQRLGRAGCVFACFFVCCLFVCFFLNCVAASSQLCLAVCTLKQFVCLFVCVCGLIHSFASFINV